MKSPTEFSPQADMVAAIDEGMRSSRPIRRNAAGHLVARSRMRDKNPTGTTPSGILSQPHDVTAASSPSKAAGLASWRPFPLETLPLSLIEFVDASAKSIGVDPAMIAVPMLSVLGAAIGASNVIELRGGGRPWREFPSIWSVIVARSSGGKTPALDCVVHPLHRHESELQALNTVARERFERDVREARRARSEPPPSPCYRRALINDATTEALAPILRDNARGLLVVRNELGGWFRGFDQYRKGIGSDLERWCELYDGKALSIDRKSDGCLYVPPTPVGLVGTIQPGALAACAGTRALEGGLIARLLIAQPPPVERRWNTADVPRDLAASYDRLIGTLLAMPGGVDQQGHPAPNVLRLSDAAARTWALVYNAFNRRVEHVGTDAEAALIGKSVTLAARLALVIQLVDAVLQANSVHADVDEGSVVRAARIAEWSLHEGRRVLALCASETLRGLTARREAIASMGGEVSVREWQRKRRLPTAESACRELGELVTAELADWMYSRMGSTVGRPSEGVRLRRDPDVCDETLNQDFWEGIVSPSGAETIPQVAATPESPAAAP